jgi:hypothetical protein
MHHVSYTASCNMWRTLHHASCVVHCIISCWPRRTGVGAKPGKVHLAVRAHAAANPSMDMANAPSYGQCASRQGVLNRAAATTWSMETVADVREWAGVWAMPLTQAALERIPMDQLLVLPSASSPPAPGLFRLGLGEVSHWCRWCV